MIQMVFREVEISEETVWQAVVLIKKGGDDYHCIGLVEVMWKAVAVTLNLRFTASITYHNSLHSFWAGRGTGTATLEVKLIQQVVALRQAVLHEILLDLHKAYNSLDRSRCLEILEVYGMGTRDLRLLCRYWERLKMVVRVGGYYGETFRRDREASHREIHCLQSSSVWWWTRWSNTWSPWWGNGRGGEVAMTTSTRRRRRGGECGKGTTDDDGRRMGMQV